MSIKRAILQKTNESLINNNNIHLKKMGEMSSEINRLYQRCRDLENQLFNNDDKEKVVLQLKDMISKKDFEINSLMNDHSNELNRLKHTLSLKDSELLKMNDLNIKISSLENTLINKDLEAKSIRESYELQLNQYKGQVSKMRDDFDPKKIGDFQNKISDMEEANERTKNEKFTIEVERDTLRERLAAKEKELGRKTNDSLQQIHHMTIELSRQDELIETGINDAMSQERMEMKRKRDSLKTKIRNLLGEFHKFSDKESEYRKFESDNYKLKAQLEAMIQKFRIYKNWITNVYNVNDILSRFESNLMSDVVLLRDKLSNPPDLSEETEMGMDYYDMANSTNQFNFKAQFDTNYFETN